MPWLSFLLLASCLATEDFRAFTDDDNHYIAIKRNAVFWGDEKYLQPLNTRRFAVTADSLTFTFTDERIHDGESNNQNTGFEHSKRKTVLYCGPHTKNFVELTVAASEKLKKKAKFETIPNQAKPVLLGLLTGTQLFIYVSATETTTNYPRFKIYFGPIRALKELTASAQALPRETTLTARDLRLVIKPGNRGSGTRVQYQNRYYNFDYLSNSEDNLIAVLGTAQYRKLFSAAISTPCDLLLKAD